MITLNDVIKCGGTAVVKTKDAQGNIQTKTVSINGNSAVDMDLKSIKVFDADTGAELAVSDYSYVISDPEVVDSTVSCSADVITNEKGKFIANFIPSESIVGAKGTIDLALPEGYENGNIKSYYVAYGYMDGNSFKEVKAFANKRSEWLDFGSSISVPVEEVSSEKAGGVFRVEYEYRDGSGFSNTEVSNEKMLSAVKCSALTAKTRDFVKKLEINVPDQRHLKLVYVYTGSPANDEDAENDGYKVHVFNNISFDTNGSAVNDSEDNDSEFELINQSKASSTTVEPFKLMKVDSGDYSIMLKASFEIYRYTKLENGTYDWLPAVDFKENAAKDRNSVIWGSSAQDKAQTFNVNADGSYNLDLEPAAGTGDTEGHLYKLIEKQSPEGYLLDETPIYFAFKVRPAVVPSEVGEDGYQFVKNGDMFRVTNLLKEFKITASKVWSDGNGNHSAESVKFLLGSSTTKVLSGVPDDIQWGSAEVTLNEANNWKHEWTKLPGYTKVGNDYKQLYYYIKEIDLATGYEAVYSATAMSKNTDVTVTNVKGLNITKEWRDELGNKLADSELPAGIDKIEADVYESSVAPNSTSRVNGDNGIPTDCKLIKTVSLEKSKNWTVALDGLDKDKYYYVLEKNIPDGFGVTYTYSNNGSATGFDTIVNTKNPQKVEKMDVRLQKAWSDSDSNAHTNDKVTFNIYRSTNKADVPEKYNKFTGTMDKGQNVKFKILTSNGTEMAQNGSFASEYAMYGSAKFSFDMTKSWINIGETEGRVRVLDSSGAVLADIYKSGENWVDGKPIPMWSGDSKYVSVSDYVTPSWDKSQFVLNLNNITSDITVELTLKGDSGCSYAVTANDLGTPEKTNVTPVPSKDATPSGEVFLWKQITLTADNNWSNAVSLEKNDIKGSKYYYWFEETDVNGQPIITSSYKAYYRYNGSENENCIDMTKNGDQYVQVYNNSEETLGELPETGGMGVIPFVAAFGVFATTDAGVNNIVIKDSDTNRVYKAYQIFDQASATNTIKWGKGINGDALLTSLKTAGLSTYMSQFDSAESAVDVAKIISDADHWTKEDTAKFAKAASACIIDNKSVTAYEDNGEYTIPLPNAGYYLVVDATENNGVDKANSALILNVSGTTNVTPKKTKPTLTKQIKHNENDSWGDVGDNAIGDDVEFKITTTIPSDVSAYDKYTYTVRDQLSEGFTFNDNLTYKYYDADGQEITSVTVGPNTTVGDDSSTTDYKESFYVTFDIKELVKNYPTVAKIETYYSAKLNEKAKVAVTAPDSVNNNPNTAYLTYSNNPQDTTGKEKGETPKVTVYDWTFSLVGNKVDEKGEPLAGAKFQLRNVHGDAIRLVKIADNVYRLEIGSEAGSVDYIETDATGKFTIKGIDDQTTYKLVETEAPAQYNRADPYEFKFDTTYDPANTLQSIRMLDGTDSGTSGSTVKIINQKGGSLPTTGGIGTQIFYGVGGAIVLGAGVLLIAKKRAKND